MLIDYDSCKEFFESLQINIAKRNYRKKGFSFMWACFPKNYFTRWLDLDDESYKTLHWQKEYEPDCFMLLVKVFQDRATFSVIELEN